MLFYTNCTCTWSLAETWSKVWGDEGGGDPLTHKSPLLYVVVAKTNLGYYEIIKKLC